MRNNNKISFSVLIIIMLLLTLTMLAACNYNEKKPTGESDEIESMNTDFTERQKKILKQEGLPTEPDKLESHQYSSIMMIEDMLAYMDEKYGGEHMYNSYTMSGFMNATEMTCYEKNNPLRIITVWMENGKFVDDYTKVIASEEYQEYLGAHLKELYGDSVFYAAKVVDDYTGEAKVEDVMANASVMADIFFPETECNEEELQRRAEELLSWLKDNSKGLYGEHELFIMPDQYFEEVNGFNWEKRMEEFSFITIRRVSIQSDGYSAIYDY